MRKAGVLRMKTMFIPVVTWVASPLRLLPPCCEFWALEELVSVVTLDGKSAIITKIYQPKLEKKKEEAAQEKVLVL